MYKLPMNGFTLIELLVVIAIIGLLATMILSSVTSAGDSADRLQVSTAISHVSTALLLHKSINNKLPPPDESHFLDYDPLLDTFDPKNNATSIYEKWPLLNKLVAHNSLQLDHELL
ncbi:MAG: prepilin-type N-terminal cleavage/methylation domain-containing protein, partial [Planctomycetes bacterium]|nr:prepilin-type N-terminal cleavage/methylation domain-containing protein [Planctomycetota bacterium]